MKPNCDNSLYFHMTSVLTITSDTKFIQFTMIYDKTCYRIKDFEIDGWDSLDSYRKSKCYGCYSDYVIVTFEEFMERENLTNEMVVD